MKVEQGQIVGGTVTGIQPYGAFIKHIFNYFN